VKGDILRDFNVAKVSLISGAHTTIIRNPSNSFIHLGKMSYGYAYGNVIFLQQTYAKERPLQATRSHKIHTKLDDSNVICYDKISYEVIPRNSNRIL